MPMKNPPHPGLSVRLNCLEPFGLSVTEGAKALGVSRTTLSRLINGQAGVSADMAIRLAKAFGATPDIWMRMQAAYDLAQARLHENEIEGKTVPAATGGVRARKNDSPSGKDGRLPIPFRPIKPLVKSAACESLHGGGRKGPLLPPRRRPSWAPKRSIRDP